MKKTIIKYSITIVISLFCCFLIMLLKDIFHQTEAKIILKIFIDSFFSVGILCVCFGLLMFSSNEGTFDILRFGLSKFFSYFRRNLGKVNHKTYYEYRVERGQKKTSFLHLIIVGAILLVVALILLIPYYA